MDFFVAIGARTPASHWPDAYLNHSLSEAPGWLDF